MALVYLLTNIENGKRYVGKTKGTIESRWYNHVKDAKSGSNYAIHRAIRKHGKDTFTRSVLSEHETEADALVAEREWIAKLGTMGDGGYNMCEGGRGAVGYAHSLEARKRMSALAITNGQRPSALALQRSAEVRTANGLSEDTKVRMAASQQKRRASAPVTDEFREKMRQARLAEARDNGGKQKPRAKSATRSASLSASWATRQQAAKPFCRICGVAQTPENTSKCARRRTGLHRRCKSCDSLANASK